MIKIEIMKGDDKALNRTVTPQGKEPFVVEYQDAYLHVESQRFPVHIQLDLKPNDGKVYPVGMYTLSSESIRVNQYKSLELDRFNVKLTSVSQGQ